MSFGYGMRCGRLGRHGGDDFRGGRIEDEIVAGIDANQMKQASPNVFGLNRLDPQRGAIGQSSEDIVGGIHAAPFCVRRLHVR